MRHMRLQVPVCIHCLESDPPQLNFIPDVLPMRLRVEYKRHGGEADERDSHSDVQCWLRGWDR